MNKCVFVGHFSSNDYKNSIANSTAANQVQLKIFTEICNVFGSESSFCISMQPMPIWPRGNFYTNSVKGSNFYFPGYINLPFLKNFVFSIKVLIYLLVCKPSVCIQYNSYLFENLTLLIYRAFSKNVIISGIVQDINCNPKFEFSKSFNIKILFERFGICVLKYFDSLALVSENIINDFNLSRERCFVFQGGLTSYSYKLLSSSLNSDHSKEKYAVFAGALESYNGIDKIVTQWSEQHIEFPLHIFGRGSLSPFIASKSQESKYITYHDFQLEEVVEKWIINANWNFCLRYSININQNYFFPSKFFNLLCLKGVLICNNFNNLPSYLLPFISIVDDNLMGLSDIIKESCDSNINKDIKSCRKELDFYHDWNICVKMLIRTSI